MKKEIDILNEINFSNPENIFENDFANKSFNEILEEKINIDLDNSKLEDYEVLKKYLETEEKWWIKNIVNFVFKYTLTSSFIFLLLLVSTNYEAYTNILKSYFQKEKMQEINNSLINSVKASNITEKTNKDFKSSENNNKSLVKSIESSIDKSVYSFTKFNDENPSLDIEITPYDNRIIIPKIWKNIPLVDIKNRVVSWQYELNNIFMEELEKWVVRYPWSSKPWELWNSFIFWHSSNFPWIKWNYNEVFALLDKLENDDEIIIYYEQKKYIYKINEKSVVKPWDVWIFKSNNDKAQVMVMTCRPIWTTLNRLVVTWELIKQ